MSGASSRNCNDEQPAPDFSSSFDIRYITGLGTVDHRMLILVNIEKLMTGSDMALMDAVH